MNSTSSDQRGTRARARVKTGCVTCRKRRVKCDEGKPACQRCVRTGRTCDGYGVWGGGSAHSSTGTATLTTAPNNLTPATWVLSQLPQSMSRQEHEAFDYFQRFMTVKLPGVFQSEFWARLTLQASAQEPAVLHAVIALSSAQRGDGSLTLRAYNTAIRQLQGHLERQDRYAIRLALIACMVFICLEFLRGSVAAGEVHLRNGLRLLQGLQKQDGKGRKSNRVITLGSHSGSVDDCLVEAFTRLNVLSALFGQAPHFLYHLSEEAGGSQGPEKSSRFETLGDARQSLDCLLNGVYSLSMRADDVVDKHLGRYPDTYRRRQRRLQASLQRWWSVFEASLLALADEEDIRTTWAISLLRLYHSMTDVMAATCLRGIDETIYDRYNPQFASILKQIKDLWDSVSDQLGEEIPRSTCQMSEMSFTADMGFIPPLYYTAIKCRDPFIRRKAIDLLMKAPHIEGAWDGKLVARVAEDVMGTEESGMYEDVDFVHDSDDRSLLTEGLLAAPPFARISNVKVESGVDGRREAMVMTKHYFPVLGEGEWRYKTANFKIALGGQVLDLDS